MTKYKATLDWLFTQLPMFQRVGAMAFKKDLTNIRKLCAALGNPQDKIKTIHIAGTNGKGSTAHMLSAVMQSHGFKTGLYTSPHYRDFRERIKIDGKLISQKAVIKFVEENKTMFEEIRPSFFEITVALAFTHFANKKVDIAIIETGLGGRLDSTNIITPLLSIITNIGFDHQQFLGDTLPLIAGEKAGIIKENVPVIVGETNEETAPVFIAKAKEMNAEITFADAHIVAEEIESPLVSEYGNPTDKTVITTFHVGIEEMNMVDDYDLNLMGAYQAKNLQTVIQSLFILPSVWSDFEPQAEKIKIGFSNLKTLTNFIGRWHLLGREPNIIADSAHNSHGITVALNQINEIYFEQLHFVIGMVNDKDIEKILSMLPLNAAYYFAKANIPRGLDAGELKKKAVSVGLKGRAYSSVKNALKAAKRKAGKDDLIYVGGSTFVVAEVV
ncbi:MAG: dihydrofolate synthase/folylpolyglutamate synthase [Saprospiraceae bacterium]|jgi:dihydrofolate synthase/folylpolyglutamate synthase